METFDCGIKLKKEIEVTELVIYPIYRKITDALTNEIIGVFKADNYTITKVVCGANCYQSINVFENTKETLSAIYWLKEATEKEYKKYLKQVKDHIG
jgi:hypothetical protein